MRPCGIAPRRTACESVLGPYEFKRHGIAAEEKFTRVKCEDFGELAQDLVRRMALAGFEMADVGGRGRTRAGAFAIQY